MQTYSKTLKRKKPEGTVLLDSESAYQSKVRSIVEKSRTLGTLSEKIAGDKFHYRNWYFEGGKEKFPFQPDMWFVDKCYPMAKGGMLLIDEPTRPDEEAKAKIKGQHLKSLGLRFVVIRQKMTLEEAEIALEECAK